MIARSFWPGSDCDRPCGGLDIVVFEGRLSAYVSRNHMIYIYRIQRPVGASHLAPCISVRMIVAYM